MGLSGNRPAMHDGAPIGVSVKEREYAGKGGAQGSSAPSCQREQRAQELECVWMVGASKGTMMQCAPEYPINRGAGRAKSLRRKGTKGSRGFRLCCVIG